MVTIVIKSILTDETSRKAYFRSSGAKSSYANLSIRAILSSILISKSKLFNFHSNYSFLIVRAKVLAPMPFG